LLKVKCFRSQALELLPWTGRYRTTHLHYHHLKCYGDIATFTWQRMGYVSRARRSGSEGETGATGNYGNTSPFLCYMATSPQLFIIENVKSVAP